jgi:hypothetical protein
VSEEAVLRTLQQRLDRPPGPGFTAEALACRADLLRSSADLLCDPERRQAYECLLTEQANTLSGAQPALELASNLEVGGLLLLMEAGQHSMAFEGARRALQPPQAPALGSGREADLTLLAALACRQGAEERRRERRFEPAALLLQQGIQLLQRMGQQQQLRQELEADLAALLPYRVLDLLSRDLTEADARSQGQLLLQELIHRRGGLDGDQDPSLPQESFQSFFQQIRSFLTVQEQIDLFKLWAQQGSVTADFLSAYALTASGFGQRKPERIEAALERLSNFNDSGVEPEKACLHLLLGHTKEAEQCFARSSDPSLSQWAHEQGDEPLAGLCVYTRDWLTRRVLPCYRDLDADPDLEAYYADRDVQAYIESKDRSRQRSGIEPAAPPFELLPTPDRAQLEADLRQADRRQAEKRLESGADTEAAINAGTEQNKTYFQEIWQDWCQNGLDWWQGGLGWLSQTSPLQRGVALALAVAATTTAGVLVGRQAKTPKEQSLLLPSPPKTAALSAPTPAAKPLPPAPPSTPDQQVRQQLDKWLVAKVELLSGGDAPKNLEQLAVPALVTRTMDDRRSDASRGQFRRISAKVENLTLVEQSPDRLEARARIRYSEELLSNSGQLLERSGPQQLVNTYIFHRDGATWRLADYRTGN